MKNSIVYWLLATPAAVSQPAWTQQVQPATAPAGPEAADAASPTDIVVTARKRAESDIRVPVVVTAISPEQIETRGIVTVEDIARTIPNFLMSGNPGSVQGGNVSLRGIAGPESSPLGDQAVTFQIDGVAIAKSSVRQLSNIDLQQIEVLSGPQALLYGKNSPAGVVSIRTADPGDSFEAMARVGYEFEAREKRLEAMVSSPLSEGLGIRLAGWFTDMDGYFKNAHSPGAYLDSRIDRAPGDRQYGGRLTLKAELGDKFSARLKVSAARQTGDGLMATTQRIFCGTPGRTFTGEATDCRANKRTVVAGTGPDLNRLNNTFRADGEPYTKIKQFLTSLELNYELSDDVSLTSTTGYYSFKLDQAFNATPQYDTAVSASVPVRLREFSQEIRVTSDYEGPLNFLAGGYFGSSEAEYRSETFFFTALPTTPFGPLCFIDDPCRVNNTDFLQKTKTYSAFLQVLYNPVEQVEIAAGGRYSRDERRLPRSLTGFGLAPPNDLGIPLGGDLAPFPLQKNRANFSNFSPEVSVSWFPTRDLTLFASYKHGFLAGAFNAELGPGEITPESDISYRPQVVKGFEGGIKALVAGDFRVNAAAYYYRIKDLQVTSYLNTTALVRNAATARVWGLELNGTYNDVMPGLDLYGGAAYTNARYIRFPNATCSTNQVALGSCTGTPPVQDLSGEPLLRSPKWNLTGGVNYEFPVGSDLKAGLSANATYITRFFTDASNTREGTMPSHAMIDATAKLESEGSGWEIALIGKNLTNKYTWSSSFNAPFNGTDRMAGINRGRQLLLQLTYRMR